MIGFSSFGVLIYYAIANASAFTQPAEERRWPRALNVLGVVGCLVLVATLPLTAVLAGLVMFGIGRLLGWTSTEAIFVALGVAIASTMLVVKGLEEHAVDWKP